MSTWSLLCEWLFWAETMPSRHVWQPGETCNVAVLRTVFRRALLSRTQQEQHSERVPRWDLQFGQGWHGCRRLPELLECDLRRESLSQWQLHDSQQWLHVSRVRKSHLPSASDTDRNLHRHIQ